MKRIIISVILVLATALSTATHCFAADVTSFSDLSPSHWAYSTVMEMVDKGLFNGTTTPVNGVGTFSPEKPMTRGEFLAVVCRMYYPDEIYTPSPDLPWWDPYFTIAVKYGLIDYQRQFVELDESITRGEAVMIITRLMTAVGTPLKERFLGTLPGGSEIIAFDNTTPLYPKMEESFRYCVGEGIIQGVDSNNNLDAMGTLTRAQAATILARITDESKRVTSVFTDQIAATKAKHKPLCAAGKHYSTNGNKEIIVPATQFKDGITRFYCLFCDYYIDQTVYRHSTSPGLSLTVSCGDKLWVGTDCTATRYAPILDYNRYRKDGYDTELLFTCESYCVTNISATNVDSYEDALHTYGDWETVAYPGRGTEGRCERTCSHCGFKEYKIIPMYATRGLNSDIRTSYMTFEYGSFSSSSDMGDTTVSRIAFDETKTADENQKALASYIYTVSGKQLSKNGLIWSYMDTGACAKVIEHPKSGKFGINVFGWTSTNSTSNNWSNSYDQLLMEMLYFASGDREIAFAIWKVLNHISLYGSENTDAKAIASYGFKVLSETDTSLELTMKDVRIEWTWGNGINGNNFYFYS